MSAETAKKFHALEDQAHGILGVFRAAGYEPVAPSILQPAEIFLDVVGEDLRGRTYVFTDPEGAELCLRPDLTIPTCRLHWERYARADAVGRYCYNGPAFRFQPDGGDAAHPREFRQAGVEFFGTSQYAQAEAEILALILKALEGAGLDDFSVTIGDLNIFEALLGVLDMPARWRQRLRAQFWRPAAFRAELEALSVRPAAIVDGLPGELVQAVRGAKAANAEQIVFGYLERNGIELIGARSLTEITDNLCAVVEDASADPLDRATLDLIEGYLGVNAPVRASGARLKDLLQSTNYDLSGPLDAYERRLKAFAALGIDLSRLSFSAEFGRNLEYYTGFVFEVQAPDLPGDSPVAGGGRYDKLMRVIGATVDVPAVGAMIHTERLLDAVQGGAG